MKIKQFKDKGLAHYSYAILSECKSEMLLIDPSRDISPYLEYAESHHSKIIGVIETHPHADFVSGHLELHKRNGATLYCSKLVGAEYPNKGFDEGDVISFGKIRLKALNTPGHSPDSISIVLEHDGKDKAVFTGDTLFVGDCGRPDLREHAGNITTARKELARQMYHSLRDKLMTLNDEVVVYPAHGAGTLCGKGLSEASSSTIGIEKNSNWCLQDYIEVVFVNELIAEQPFIPKYFPYDVAVNKRGASDLKQSLEDIPVVLAPISFHPDIIIIDIRPEQLFKAGHLPNSINLQDNIKFETWLGSIIGTEEAFYLLAESADALDLVIGKTAKIGYEHLVEKAVVFSGGAVTMPSMPLTDFKANPDHYTIVDIRNTAEVKAHPIFEQSINIPLYQLRERLTEIPLDKPIVVHCAGGYRSAAGSSILQIVIAGKTPLYDFGESITGFINKTSRNKRN